MARNEKINEYFRLEYKMLYNDFKQIKFDENKNLELTKEKTNSNNNRVKRLTYKRLK